MSAQQLIQDITWAFYLFIFFRVLIQAIRRPLRANVDIALFFATSALIIVISTGELLGWLPVIYLAPVSVVLLLALPYLLLRLVDDFTFVPVWLKRAAAFVFLLLLVTAAATPSPYPD